MTDPTQADALRYLKVPAATLTTSEFASYLADVKEMLPGETDRLTLLFGTCWVIAMSDKYQYVTRIGDKGFSAPDPDVYKKLYCDQCNRRGVGQRLTEQPRLRKVNTVKDDYPDNYDPS